MKQLESGNYALSIPYRNDEALDKTVHDLLTEISQRPRCAIVLSRRMPGKKAQNGGGKAYVGFRFHCSPNPSTP